LAPDLSEIESQIPKIKVNSQYFSICHSNLFLLFVSLQLKITIQNTIKKAE
jgi:hypothetical protein